jgi:hypothetical protein
MRTRPTTPAGLAALTGWAREQAHWCEANATVANRTFLTVTATIDDAARGMSGLQPWTPPTVVKTEADPIFAAIEKHKQALRQMAAASDEARRLMKLAETKFGQWEHLPEKDRKAFSIYLDSISPNGDHDTVVDAAADHLGDMTWDMSKTVPNSLSGLLAFASYGREMIEHKETTFDEEDLKNMMLSLAEAAEEIERGNAT